MPGSDLIKGIVAIWKALEKGDDERVYQVYFPLASLLLLQLPALDTYLAMEKYLLFKQGVFKNYLLRQPAAFGLDPYTAEEADRLFVYYEAALRE